MVRSSQGSIKIQKFNARQPEEPIYEPTVREMKRGKKKAPIYELTVTDMEEERKKEGEEKREQGRMKNTRMWKMKKKKKQKKNK